MLITSKDNQTIKNIRKIKEKKTNQFIVEGIKMVKEAISEKQDIALIVVLENTKIDFDISNYKSIEVTQNVFETLTDVVTPQGILAVINKHNQDFKIDYNNDYFIALDNIQDPGNLGTIIRTCDSAGIKQIIVTKNTVNAFSSKVIRSTMGSIFRVQIIESDNLEETFKEFKKNGFQIVSTALDATKSIYDVDYNKKVVVIGNEANGVEKSIQNMSDIRVKIPMVGKAESLNAAVATSIMIYERVRQKLDI